MLKPNSKINFKTMKYALYGVAAVAAMILVPMSIGINNAGQRTVVQWPSGYTFVKFMPGMYIQMFGSTWEYNDLLTMDFDKETNSEEATLDQPGVRVRYRDGGLGTVYGVARFELPPTEEDMLKTHKAFRSSKGIATKMLKNVVESTLNHTAGLMTSEESYAEKRGVYAQQAEDQLINGKYRTNLKSVTEIEYGYEYCLEDDLSEALEAECEDVKRTTVRIPVIALDNTRQPIHLSSDLTKYGINPAGFEIVDWGYEDKTLNQISEKRKATMAIITAKANAEKAKQDAITAEQQGLANVTVAKYEQEVEKERAVVIAEREKEVAVIAAQKLVDVAEQQKLEQEQLKLAMGEYKQAQTLKGEGDAAYKRQVIEADGALAQKLETYERVNARYAEAIGRQKWVPEVQMGSDEGATGDSAASLVEMFTVKTAKDLALDMSIKP